MTIEEYYTAPPQHVFDEIKQGALEIWNTYEDPYRTEKINRIKDIENVQDNAWYMVAMFDRSNQFKLMLKVSEETRKMILNVISEE